MSRTVQTSIPNTNNRLRENGEGTENLTDSGFPRILEMAFEASLRMSAATTVSTGKFVNKFKVGIFPLLLVMGMGQTRLRDLMVKL